MIIQNVQAHNFDEATRIEGRPGVLLQRIPDRLGKLLKPGTYDVYRRPAGGEIRFVTGWKPASVTLAGFDGPCSATLFYGGFQDSVHPLGPEPTEIPIQAPEFLSRLPDDGSYPFSPRVCRLLLDGGHIHLVGVKGDSVRPPEQSELPRLRGLAYGTSITHGRRASGPQLSFVKLTARFLGADLLNYGANGCALCEPEIADYLAAHDDWSYATLGLSVNMLNQGFTVGEFRRRAAYLAGTLARKHPGRPVVCIGLLPFFYDRGFRQKDRIYRSDADTFRRALSDIVRSAGLPNLYYIDGRDLMRHYDGLSSDLLHPGDYGMIEIAHNLAGFLRPRLESA